LIPTLSQWNCDPHSKSSDGLAGSKGHDLQLYCQIYGTKECFLEKWNQIAHFSPKITNLLELPQKPDVMGENGLHF
jgi:hypothetical protein